MKTAITSLAMIPLLTGCFYIPNMKRTVNTRNLRDVQVGKTSMKDVLDHFAGLPAAPNQD